MGYKILKFFTSVWLGGGIWWWEAEGYLEDGFVFPYTLSWFISDIFFNTG